MKTIAIIFSLFIALNSFAQAKKIYASSVLVKDGLTGWQNNSKRLQALINNAPWGSSIIFPNGNYYLTDSIVISKKQLHLIGAEDTWLKFNQGVSGLIFDNNSSTTCYISDLNVRGEGSRFGTNGNGIRVHTRIIMSNCFIDNFGGYGVLISADLGRPVPCDASRSILTNVEVSYCGKDGFHTQGGDTNGIAFYTCSARDCDDYGFWDYSFLGDSFYSCMTHANKKGGYRSVGSLNNRTVFVACYGETDQPESEIGGVTVVIGGICAWKIMSPYCTVIQNGIRYE